MRRYKITGTCELRTTAVVDDEVVATDEAEARAAVEMEVKKQYRYPLTLRWFDDSGAPSSAADPCIRQVGIEEEDPVTQMTEKEFKQDLIDLLVLGGAFRRTAQAEAYLEEASLPRAAELAAVHIWRSDLVFKKGSRATLGMGRLRHQLNRLRDYGEFDFMEVRE